jgi:hypothetical protein
MLKKVGCEHMKAVGQPDFRVFLDDIKSPSTKASNFKRIFFIDIWSDGGRS